MTVAALEDHDAHHPVVPEFKKVESENENEIVEACTEISSNPVDFATKESGEKCAIHAAENGQYWTTFFPQSGECQGFQNLSIDKKCFLHLDDSTA